VANQKENLRKNKTASLTPEGGSPGYRNSHPPQITEGAGRQRKTTKRRLLRLKRRLRRTAPSGGKKKKTCQQKKIVGEFLLLPYKGEGGSMPMPNMSSLLGGSVHRLQKRHRQLKGKNEKWGAELWGRKTRELLSHEKSKL